MAIIKSLFKVSFKTQTFTTPSKLISNTKCLVYSANKAYYSSSSNVHVNNKSGKLKIAFFGTDLFSVRILQGLNNLLNENKIAQINVITTSPRPTSTRERSFISKSQDANTTHSLQILDFCAQNNINHHIWSEIKVNKSYRDLLKSFDIGLVASFGHLLPASLIEIFP